MSIFINKNVNPSLSQKYMSALKDVGQVRVGYFNRGMVYEGQKQWCCVLSLHSFPGSSHTIWEGSVENYFPLQVIPSSGSLSNFEMSMVAVNIAFPSKGALCVFDVVHIFTLKKRTISLLPPGTAEGENENPLPAGDSFISHSMMFDSFICFYHMFL